MGSCLAKPDSPCSNGWATHPMRIKVTHSNLHALPTDSDWLVSSYEPGLVWVFKQDRLSAGSYLSTERMETKTLSETLVYLNYLTQVSIIFIFFILINFSKIKGLLDTIYSKALKFKEPWHLEFWPSEINHPDTLFWPSVTGSNISKWDCASDKSASPPTLQLF